MINLCGLAPALEQPEPYWLLCNVPFAMERNSACPRRHQGEAHRQGAWNRLSAPGMIMNGVRCRTNNHWNALHIRVLSNYRRNLYRNFHAKLLRRSHRLFDHFNGCVRR